VPRDLRDSNNKNSVGKVVIQHRHKILTTTKNGDSDRQQALRSKQSVRRVSTLLSDFCCYVFFFLALPPKGLSVKNVAANKSGNFLPLNTS
jgi:hypothetical protein